MLVAFLAVPAFNWLTVTLAVARNDVTMLDQFGGVRPPRPAQMELIQSLIRDDPRQILLLGTSQVGQGVETCDTPQIGRYWSNGIDGAEMAGLVQAAFAGEVPGRTVIVDFAGTVGHRFWREAELPLQIFGYDLPLARRMAMTTLAWHGPQSDRLCQSNLNPATPGFEGEGARNWVEFMRGLWNDRDFTGDLHTFVDAVEGACARSGGDLRLVWFPHFQDTDSAATMGPIYTQGSAAMEAVLAARAPSDCTITFVNIAQRWHDLALAGEPSPRAGWIDYNHFRPRLGAAFLQEALGGPHAQP